MPSLLRIPATFRAAPYRAVARASLLRILATGLGVIASVTTARLGGPELKGVASAYAASSVLTFTIVNLDLAQQLLRHGRMTGDIGAIPARLLRSWALLAPPAAVFVFTLLAMRQQSAVWIAAGALSYLLSTQLGVVTNGVAGPETVAWSAVVQQSAMIVGTVVFYAAFTLNRDTVQLVFCLSNLAPLPYLLRRALGAAKPTESSARMTPRLLARTLAGGLVWQGARVSQLMLLRLDTIAAFTLLGASHAGVYSVGLSTAGLASIVPTQFAARATHAATTGVAMSLRRDTAGALMSGAAVGVAICGIGWFALPTIYGDDFGASFAVLVATMPGVVLYGAVQVMTNYIRLSRPPWMIALPSFVGVVIMVACIAGLAPLFGTVGIGIASSAGSTSAAVATYLVLRRTARPRR